MNLNLTKVTGAAFALAAMAAGAAACAGSVTGPLPNSTGTGAPFAEAAADSSAPVRTVTGSGRLVLPGVDTQISITARLLADGTPTGVLTFNAHDMSGFGLPGHNIIKGEIDCLEFDGNKVWFGASIKHTTMPPPPGGGPHPPAIGVIVDSETGDRLYTGPSLPGQSCHDRPFLPEFPVDGNFKIE